jgi:hypothetical protein
MTITGLPYKISDTPSEALPYVSPSRAPAAQHYLDVLARMSEEVERLDELHHAGPYAQQWVCLALAQGYVVDDLRRSAGLPVFERAPSVSTPKVCQTS